MLAPVSGRWQRGCLRCGRSRCRRSGRGAGVAARVAAGQRARVQLQQAQVPRVRAEVDGFSGLSSRRRSRRSHRVAPATGAAVGAVAEVEGTGPPVAAAPSETTARTVPTSTVSPSGTRISDTTPPAGEGTSESTLSVETSNSGSSRSTGSPTCFSQRVIVPSVTVSPSCGMITSANVQSPSGESEGGLAEPL